MTNEDYYTTVMKNAHEILDNDLSLNGFLTALEDSMRKHQATYEESGQVPSNQYKVVHSLDLRLRYIHEKSIGNLIFDSMTEGEEPYEMINERFDVNWEDPTGGVRETLYQYPELFSDPDTGSRIVALLMLEYVPKELTNPILEELEECGKDRKKQRNLNYELNSFDIRNEKFIEYIGRVSHEKLGKNIEQAGIHLDSFPDPNELSDQEIYSNESPLSHVFLKLYGQ